MMRQIKDKSETHTKINQRQIKARIVLSRILIRLYVKKSKICFGNVPE